MVSPGLRWMQPLPKMDFTPTFLSRGFRVREQLPELEYIERMSRGSRSKRQLLSPSKVLQTECTSRAARHSQFTMVRSSTERHTKVAMTHDAARGPDKRLASQQLETRVLSQDLLGQKVFVMLAVPLCMNMQTVLVAPAIVFLRFRLSLQPPRLACHPQTVLSHSCSMNKGPDPRITLLPSLHVLLCALTSDAQPRPNHRFRSRNRSRTIRHCHSTASQLNFGVM